METKKKQELMERLPNGKVLKKRGGGIPGGEEIVEKRASPIRKKGRK